MTFWFQYRHTAQTREVKEAPSGLTKCKMDNVQGPDPVYSRTPSARDLEVKYSILHGPGTSTSLDHNMKCFLKYVIGTDY